MSLNITQILQQVISLFTSMLPLFIQLMILGLVIRLMVSAFKPASTKEAVKKEEKAGESK